MPRNLPSSFSTTFPLITMTEWIELTPSRFLQILNGTQQETLGARPHQGTVLDPLSIALAAATNQVRSAIRANGLNRLSANPKQLPAELLDCACAIALLQLSQNWPLLTVSLEQAARIDAIEPELQAIADGTTPVALPSDPEPGNTVRRSIGIDTLHRRSKPLRSESLRGL